MVTMLGDFVSQRLQIRVQGESGSAKKAASSQAISHASMIYTRLVNLDKLITILTGITPTDQKAAVEQLDKFLLPKALEPFYLK